MLDDGDAIVRTGNRNGSARNAVVDRNEAFRHRRDYQLDSNTTIITCRAAFNANRVQFNDGN